VKHVITFVFVCSFLALSSCKQEAPAAHGTTPPASTDVAAVAAACEHGVQKDICARCNPALKPAFVAKNDWCGEHDRPESQCVICHPDLAKKGIK
jgi:hypothetical protein